MMFVGITKTQLQEMLQKAQQARFDLATGQKGVSFSYTQGDGTRSVTYTQANMNDLLALIQELQMALGISCRRAVGFRY